MLRTQARLAAVPADDRPNERSRRVDRVEYEPRIDRFVEFDADNTTVTWDDGATQSQTQSGSNNSLVR